MLIISSKIRGIGIPKKVPFPIRTYCFGNPEIDSPFRIPTANPLNKVLVPKVARMGATLTVAIRKPFTTPQSKPNKSPMNMEKAIHRFNDIPVLAGCCVIMKAVVRPVILAILTMERSIPPVIMESITAIPKIAISGI